MPDKLLSIWLSNVTVKIIFSEILNQEDSIGCVHIYEHKYIMHLAF